MEMVGRMYANGTDGKAIPVAAKEAEYNGQVLPSMEEVLPVPPWLIGAWEPPSIELDPPAPALVPKALRENVWLCDGVLSAADCRRLREVMAASARLLPVSVQGRSDLPDSRVGSLRVTAWAPRLGCALWEKIRTVIPASRLMSDTTPTAWHAPTPHRQWRPVGVGPVLRFMRYDAGGMHHGHYDRSFDHGDGRRTLMSLVLYLSDVREGHGGRTRFLRDGQEKLPIHARDLEDWPQEAREEDVLFGVTPVEGRALFFDHMLCHDIERYTGPSPRVIIRADIVFFPVTGG